MADSLVTPSAVKVLHDTSDLLFIPLTILALWSQGAQLLLPHVWGSSYAALVICCVLGFLGAIGLYQLLAWIAVHTAYSFFPTFGAGLAGAGLIVVFQDAMSLQVAHVTPFTGVAMVVWGLLLHAVHDRVIEGRQST